MPGFLTTEGLVAVLPCDSVVCSMDRTEDSSGFVVDRRGRLAGKLDRPTFLRFLWCRCGAGNWLIARNHCDLGLWRR